MQKQIGSLFNILPVGPLIGCVADAGNTGHKNHTGSGHFGKVLRIVSGAGGHHLIIQL